MEVTQDLIKFIAQHRAEGEVWYNPKITLPESLDGFNFVPKAFVTGVVVFGNEYPLHGRDILPEDHLKVKSALDNCYIHGMVFEMGYQTGEKREKFYRPRTSED